MKHRISLWAPVGLLALAAAPASSQTIENQWSTGGVFAGGLEYDAGVVWVVDSSVDEIQCFDRDGNPIQTVAAPSSTVIGAGYDPMRGTLWVGDESEVCIEVDASNGAPTGVSFVTTPAITDVSGVAVDPITGHIFVSQDSSPQLIVEFDRAGVPLNTIDLSATGSVDPDGLAYNPVTQTFLTGEDATDLILEIDGTGALVGQWDVGALGISPEGLGIDLMAGTVFIADGLGATVFEVSGIVDVATTFLLYGLAPVDVAFSNNDTLRVFPINHIDSVRLGRLPAAWIPNDPSFIGLHSYWQAMRYDPLGNPSDPVQTSNGLDFEFGGGVTSYGVGTGLVLKSSQPIAMMGSWTDVLLEEQ